MPTRSYAICSVQRSGTHLLCDALRQTGLAGNPSEHFLRMNRPAWQQLPSLQERREYVYRVLESTTSPNGIFGIVLMWGHFDVALRELGLFPEFEGMTSLPLLRKLLPELRFIRLIRRDKVRQAVSWSMALQTELFVKREGESGSSPEAHFDFNLIDRMHERTVRDEASWTHFFAENKIEPLIIYYEDLVASYRETLRHVMDYLALPLAPDYSPPQPTVRQIATRRNEEWRDKYMRIRGNKLYFAIYRRLPSQPLVPRLVRKITSRT